MHLKIHVFLSLIPYWKSLFGYLHMVLQTQSQHRQPNPCLFPSLARRSPPIFKNHWVFSKSLSDPFASFQSHYLRSVRVLPNWGALAKCVLNKPGAHYSKYHLEGDLHICAEQLWQRPIPLVHLAEWCSRKINLTSLLLQLKTLHRPWCESAWIPEQSTTDWVAPDVYFLTLLGARSLRSRFYKVGFFRGLTPWLEDGHLLPGSSHGLFAGCPSLLLEGHSPVGSGSTLGTSPGFNYHFTYLISKDNHILRFRGIEGQSMNFGRGGPQSSH